MTEATEETPIWKYFVPGLGEYLMVKDLLSATKAEDPVGIGLGGLALVPFLGMTRAAKRGYGYHGTRNSPEEIIEKGFKTGSSAELGLPGTSVTLDPTVALRSGFGSGDPRRVVAAEFKTKPLPLKPSDYIAGQVPQGGLIYSKPNLVFNEAETFARRIQSPEARAELTALEKQIDVLSKESQRLMTERMALRAKWQKGVASDWKAGEDASRLELKIKEISRQQQDVSSQITKIQTRISKEGLEADLPTVVSRALSPQDLRFIERSQEEATDASGLIYEALKSGSSLPGKWSLSKYVMGLPGPLRRTTGDFGSAIKANKIRSNYPASYAGFALSDLSKAVSLLEGLPGESLKQTGRIFQAAAPLLKYKATGKEDDVIAEALAGRMNSWTRAMEEVMSVGSNTLANKKALAADPAASATYNRAYAQLMASRSALLNAVKAAGALPQGRKLGQDRIILQALRHDPSSIAPRGPSVKKVQKQLSGELTTSGFPIEDIEF